MLHAADHQVWQFFPQWAIVESFAASNAAINDSVRRMSGFGLESYQRAATHW
jgi:hypothetical protein